MNCPSPSTDIFNHPTFIELQRKYLEERAKRLEHENTLKGIKTVAQRAIDKLDREMKGLHVFAGSLDEEGQRFIQGIIRKLNVKI